MVSLLLDFFVGVNFFLTLRIHRISLLLAWCLIFPSVASNAGLFLFTFDEFSSVTHMPNSLFPSPTSHVGPFSLLTIPYQYPPFTPIFFVFISNTNLNWCIKSKFPYHHYLFPLPAPQYPWCLPGNGGIKFTTRINAVKILLYCRDIRASMAEIYNQLTRWWE